MRRALPILAALAFPLAAAGETETSDTESEVDAAGESVSCGWPNRGSIHGAVELPVEGTGYVIPGPWRARDLRYGTHELVDLIERVAARVRREHPGAVVGVADMSARGGGRVPRHISHQAGRDADLIYYALDEEGEPMEPDAHMPWYKRSGQAHYARSPEFEREIPARRFDKERNWELVKALITDEEAEVVRLFVSWRIRRWLLEHARAKGEPKELVARARKVLIQPSNAGAHNDHMHVRIGCSEHDTRLGRCRDNSGRSPRGGGKWRGGGRCPKVEPEPAGDTD